VASRLVCSKCGNIVFAVGFLFYFFTTYDLISVSVRYDDELHLSAANDAVGSTPINSSFDLLFGNRSCQGDLLGTPPYLRAANVTTANIVQLHASDFSLVTMKSSRQLSNLPAESGKR